MRIERRIDIKISLAQAREQVAAYLQQVGYKPEEAGPTLTFKRGSKLGTWTSFSPRKWQARARVDLAQASSAASPESGGGGFPLTTAIITIDVDTSGQMVTQGEREFWAQEVDGLVRTLYGELIDPASLPRRPRRLRWQELLAVIGGMILGIAVGIAVGVLLHAQYVGIGIGVGICMWVLQRALGVEQVPKV